VTESSFSCSGYLSPGMRCKKNFASYKCLVKPPEISGGIFEWPYDNFELYFWSFALSLGATFFRGLNFKVNSGARVACDIPSVFVYRSENRCARTSFRIRIKVFWRTWPHTLQTLRSCTMGRATSQGKCHRNPKTRIDYA
jgi:hypothetical protein